LTTLAAELRPADIPWRGPDQQAAAVLILLSDDPDPELVFTARSLTLLHHPGQISFPGGAWEPGDDTPADTALREANEETDLDPHLARVIGQYPQASLSITQFSVLSVVAWWAKEKPLRVVDENEVDTILRWRISELADPANRYTATYLGYAGPAWIFGDWFLWGFTAGLVDRLLRLGGWHQDWDETRTRPVPQRFR
jgi:8-oxo-dGTP pyrophosphatase MutT (NUDIX family)